MNCDVFDGEIVRESQRCSNEEEEEEEEEKNELDSNVAN